MEGGLCKLHGPWGGGLRHTELEGTGPQAFGQHPTEIKEETCLAQGCRSEFRSHLIPGSCGPGRQNVWAEDTWLETEISFIKKGKPLPRTDVGS